MATPRRTRYYAYHARQGGVLWMDRKTHNFMQLRPHTIPHFQCTGFDGRTLLMTDTEFQEKRRQWREALTSRAFAVA